MKFGFDLSLSGLANSRRDNSPRNGVQAIQRAASGFVDIVMVSNSHGRMDGKGLNWWMAARLAEQYGSWATPLSFGFASADAQHTGYSADLGTHVIDTSEPWFLPDGETLAGSTNGGVYFHPVGEHHRSQVNPTSALRVHYGYAEFAAGAGSFSLTMRAEVSPYNTIFSEDNISTSGAEDSYQIGTYDLAADPSRTASKYAVGFNRGGEALAGPFLGYFIRVEDRDATHGVCVNVAYSVGGASLRAQVDGITAKDDTQEVNFFTELRRLQLARGQDPNIVIMVNEGHNQRNEGGTSLGPGAYTDGDSPEAFLDNLVALQTHYEDLWRAQGWSVRELTYVVFVDHPISDPDDDELVSYRAIMETSSLARTSFFDWTDVTSYTELFQTGSFKDVLHLSSDEGKGYDILASGFVQEIST